MIWYYNSYSPKSWHFKLINLDTCLLQRLEEEKSLRCGDKFVKSKGKPPQIDFSLALTQTAREEIRKCGEIFERV